MRWTWWLIPVIPVFKRLTKQEDLHELEDQVGLSIVILASPRYRIRSFSVSSLSLQKKKDILSKIYSDYSKKQSFFLSD